MLRATTSLVRFPAGALSEVALGGLGVEAIIADAGDDAMGSCNAAAVDANLVHVFSFSAEAFGGSVSVDFCFFFFLVGVLTFSSPISSTFRLLRRGGGGSFGLRFNNMVLRDEVASLSALGNRSNASIISIFWVNSSFRLASSSARIRANSSLFLSC